jgi:predicted transposase YdaD
LLGERITLAQTDDPAAVLRNVAAKIEQISERNLQADVSSAAFVLAGLVLEIEQIQQILRRDIMRESVTYQDILAEGRAEGKAEAERSLVLRQLNRKLGNLTPQLHDRVNSLSIERVESLGEALLYFMTVTDLENWFAAE